MFDKKTGLTIESKRGYSKYMLSDANFDAIVVGQSTCSDIEKLFNKKLRNTKRNIRIILGDNRVLFSECLAFLFELDLSHPIEAEQVVVGKSKDCNIISNHGHGQPSFRVGYLVEEVLQRQPEAVQDFLLRTSLLDRLCGSLCDDLLLNPKVSGPTIDSSIQCKIRGKKELFEREEEEDAHEREPHEAIKGDRH